MSTASPSSRQFLEAGDAPVGVLLKRGDEVEELLANLSRTSARLAELSERLSSAKGALPRLLEDREYAEKVLDDVQHATQDLAELAAKANRGSGTVAQLVNDPNRYGEVKGMVSSTRSSWAFRLYRGLSALFPPYDDSEEPPRLPRRRMSLRLLEFPVHLPASSKWMRCRPTRGVEGDDHG